MLLLAAALLAVLGVALLLLSRRSRAAVGIPVGRVVYSDAGAWRRVERPLLSRRYGLVGKPDYIVETAAGPAPVEVKPTRRAQSPYLSDVLQLAAYCLLVEEAWGRAPRHGLLRYAERTFEVEYTAELRAVVLETLADMRAQARAPNVARDHDEPGRCRACGVRAHCDQALA